MNNAPSRWQALFTQHAPALLLFARQRGCSFSDAEDAVQEAFVKLIQKNVEPKSPVEYLFVVVRRTILDQRRSTSRRRSRELLAGEQRTWFEHCNSTVDDRDSIENGLRQLSESQRDVVVLKIWSGLTFEAIARVLDISPNTAASQYRYALQHLRTAFDAQPKEHANDQS